MAAYVEADCTLDLDATNIDADPLFVNAATAVRRQGLRLHHRLPRRAAEPRRSTGHLRSTVGIR